MAISREPARKAQGVWWGIRKGGPTCFAAGALLLMTYIFAIQVLAIPSTSMAPTLLPGDFVLVNRMVYHLHPPHRGDIIAFRFPQTSKREFIKRVIALPGDTVEELEGRVYVNGRLLAQTIALDDKLRFSQFFRQVPAAQLFVLGDNAKTSLDSRFWGTVDEQEVVGEAVFICWSRGTHWWQLRWNRMGHRLPYRSWPKLR